MTVTNVSVWGHISRSVQRQGRIMKELYDSKDLQFQITFLAKVRCSLLPLNGVLWSRWKPLLAWNGSRLRHRKFITRASVYGKPESENATVFLAKRGVMIPGIPCVDCGNWGWEGASSCCHALAFRNSSKLCSVFWRTCYRDSRLLRSCHHIQTHTLFVWMMSSKYYDNCDSRSNSKLWCRQEHLICWKKSRMLGNTTSKVALI